MNKKITISFAILLSFTSIKIFSQGWIGTSHGMVQTDLANAILSGTSATNYTALNKQEKKVKKKIETFEKEYNNRRNTKVVFPATAILNIAINKEFNAFSHRLWLLKKDITSSFNPINFLSKSKNLKKIANLENQLKMLRKTFVSEVNRNEKLYAYNRGEQSNLYQNFIIYSKRFNKRIDAVDKSINKYKLQARYILK
jgi:hypothetical protein